RASAAARPPDPGGGARHEGHRGGCLHVGSFGCGHDFVVRCAGSAVLSPPPSAPGWSACGRTNATRSRRRGDGGPTCCCGTTMDNPLHTIAENRDWFAG